MQTLEQNYHPNTLCPKILQAEIEDMQAANTQSTTPLQLQQSQGTTT